MSTPIYVEISHYIGDAEKLVVEGLIAGTRSSSPCPVSLHGNMSCWFDLADTMTLQEGAVIQRTKPLVTANLWNDRNVPPDGSRPVAEPDIIMVAEYLEVFGQYEWELCVRIEYLRSGLCGTLTRLVTLGQLGPSAADADESNEPSPMSRSATVEIKAPDEWDPRHYYASEYVEVTEVVDLEQTDMRWSTAGYSSELLNADWYYPLQFIAKRELAYVAIGTDGWEYETWQAVARGWRRDLTDLTDQLPNYEPHVLLCSQYEEFEADDGGWDTDLTYRLYARADLLKQPEMKALRNASVKWKLSRPSPCEPC